MAIYTDRKVYQPLADKLGQHRPGSAHIARYSVQGDAQGIAAQRTAHCSIYANNPDIATIATFPDEAWDPARPAVGAKYGITWIQMSDLHHEARGHEPVAAVVVVGDAVFLSISLSSTVKHIKRADAEDLNGTTALVMGVLNHFSSLREVCWADDVTRANRDNADWTAITDKCRVRDVVMVFGGQRYDQSNPGDRLALGALGLVGGNDDPTRRRRLTGKRLMKYKQGGAAISEDQMPQGWHHKRDQFGRPVLEGDKGLVPEAAPAMAPVLAALYAAHAAGETYQQLADRLITFEADGAVRRRDHTNLDNSYAATVDSPVARYDAAKSFFVRTTFRPSTLPSEASIHRYLAGEDPADLFDADTRLFLAKVELVRTGRYFRRLKSDIRGRGIVLDGIPATYRDDRDEYGWFDVLSAPWAWPVTESGAVIERFGISDHTCRQVAARLLRELRAPKAPTGGRAHRTTTRRALQGYHNWLVPPTDADARYDDEETEWGVEARVNNSGKANFILLFRRASAANGPRGRRAWSNVGPGQRRPDHIAATGSLAELCASVAHHLDAKVRELADPEQLATVTARSQIVADADPTPAWRTRIAVKEAEIADLEQQAKGLRAFAARMIAAGDDTEAESYAGQAIAVSHEVTALRRDIAKLDAKIGDHQRQPHEQPASEDHADVSIAAYLVAGLERAATNNGDAPRRLGEVCDETFSEWRFHADGDALLWSALATLPLAGGGNAELTLGGTITNVRTRAGKALATRAMVATYVFAEGRSLDAIADLLEVTRKTLLTQRVMPWLVEHGITSRGAKCALVDHPVPAVRRAIHARLTTGQVTSPSGYNNLLVQTYLDPGLSWGDAATPDETTWIQSALDRLSVSVDIRRRGLPVLDLALSLGRTEADIRRLVEPAPRPSGGFVRPQYLEYADQSRRRVRAIPCPHSSCRARSATHVALLPEVAASDYGVICRTCRRAPSCHAGWAGVQFPNAYLTSWSNTGKGGLRTQQQTSAALAA